MQLETQSQTSQQNPTPPIPVEQGSELTPLSVIRTETVLSKLPVHNLAKKGRVDIQIIKLGTKGEVELKWEVSYSERYGQARQLAYKLDTIVVDHHIDESGRPLPERICLGSLNEIAQELGLMADHGTTHKNLKKAFRQNALAGITAKFKYKTNDGSERTLEATFTRYSVIFTGEKFSDGRKADAVYIELNPVYRDVLNNAPIRPLNLDYKKQLAPGPQRFYEIVSYKFFSALKNNLPTANLAYSEYCTFSAQQRYFDYDHFKKQMYKIHRPHLQSGYITKIKFDQSTDEQGRADWLMRYIPGPKARDEFATFTGKKLRTIDASAEKTGAGESRTVSTHRPRQRRLALRPLEVEEDQPAASPRPVIIDYLTVYGLAKFGISEADARQQLASLPPDYPIRDVLEYAQIEINRPGARIQNPAGFVISLLQQRSLPPSTFESSQAIEARQQAEFAQQQALQDQVEVEEAARAAEEIQLDQFKANHPQEFQALYDQAQAELFSKHPGIALFAKAHPGSSLHEGAIRARIRQLLQQGSVAPKPEDSPGPTPPSFTAMLQAVLNRPQLKGPKPAPATPEDPQS